MDYIGKVMQHPTFCMKNLQKFSSMKIEAHMVFNAIAENFNHCLCSLHLLDATVSTTSSTLSTTTLCTPLPTPDGEFYFKFDSSYSLVLIRCCSYHPFDPSYLHKFANKCLRVVVHFGLSYPVFT